MSPQISWMSSIWACWQGRAVQIWVARESEIIVYPAEGRRETIQTMPPFIAYTQNNKLLWSESTK